MYTDTCIYVYMYLLYTCMYVGKRRDNAIERNSHSRKVSKLWPLGNEGIPYVC